MGLSDEARVSGVAGDVVVGEADLVWATRHLGVAWGLVDRMICRAVAQGMPPWRVVKVTGLPAVDVDDILHGRTP